MNNKGTFGQGIAFGGPQSCNQILRLVIAFHDPGSAQDLESQLSDIVHQKESHPVIMQQITNTDVLLVAPKVSEAKRLIVHDVQEPLWAAAVLDIGPSGLAHRSHVEPIPSFDEGALVLTQPITRHASLFYPLVLTTAAVSLLLLLN